MFLAALDQTVVSTAIRTIADDLNGYDLQAWATTALLITSTISPPLYRKVSHHLHPAVRQAPRPLRPATVLPVRDRHLRRRRDALRPGRLDVPTGRLPGD